jgi:ABC-type nickel/cobalt efflux system permease component RcnA
MGLAGGMVPSPSAVLVLIGAATLGQLWFGILLVVAYGAGLALALVAIGFLIVGAGARLAAAVSLPPRLHRLRAPLRTLHRIAPTATATMVIVLGAALTLRAALSA